MVQSRLLGIVPIKMFGSGLETNFSEYGENYSSFGLSAPSDNPMLPNAMDITEFGVIPQFSSIVLAVGGLSQMVNDPDGQPLGGSAQIFVDGIVWAVGPPSMIVGSAPTIYYRPQPNGPGNWDAVPISFYSIPSSEMPPPQRFLTSFGPSLIQGSKKIGGFITSNVNDKYPYLAWDADGAEIIGTPVFNHSLTEAAQDAVTLQCRVHGNTLFDNCTWFSISGIGTTTGPSVAYFNSSDITNSFFIEPITMDNEVLNAAFTNANNVNAMAYGKGFIFALEVDGSGPTKARTEIAVFTSDMSGYYLLSFQPQDAEAMLQLGRNTGVPVVKIDTNGIIWYNSGAPADQGTALYSFSSGFQFPVYYFGNLQPIVLACFEDTMAQGLYA